ncbi:MAG: DNA replication/repair protein RecF [Ferruginibacter sp.]
MLKVKHIRLTQFRNHLHREWSFNKPFVAICGNNGVGKTTLLDALYCICHSKSYMSSQDSQVVTYGKDGYRLDALLEKLNTDVEVVVVLRDRGKKELLLNGVKYDRIAQHIGQFPAVIITPDDIDIINGGSEQRRKWLDGLLGQTTSDYLQHWIQYSKILSQRHAYLKTLNGHLPVDDTVFNILDQQLVLPGERIYQYRKQAIQPLSEMLKSIYQHISKTNELTRVHYHSKLEEHSFDDLLKKNRRIDVLTGRTNAGIHKDELQFDIDDRPFKTHASQGQKKSLLFSLKLAAYEWIRQHKGFSPILLLDDVFEKLDELRMNQLIQWVTERPDSQVFITDTHPGRIQACFERFSIDGEIILLS